MALVAAAGQLRFPSTEAHAAHWYPTAYVDHDGVDWACGDIRYGGHRGSDFGGGGFAGMDAGRDVVAAAAGRVITVNDGELDRCTSGTCAGGGGFGNYVKLLHADGRVTYYAHLKQWSVAVAPGEHVACGQALGQMGSSGYSTGPHLHLELREVDPSDVDVAWAVDPFEGACSATESRWVSQGEHGAIPGLVCDAPPDCPAGEPLACGDVRAFSTAGASALGHHGCTDWSYSGPEAAWTLVTSLDEPVRIDVTGLGADVDLYVVEGGTCDGSACVAASEESEASDEGLSFDARAGVVYTVLVDGFEGATSSGVISVACEGERPDSGGEVNDTSGGGWREEPASCGCATQRTPSLAPLLLALAGLSAPRRAARRRN